MKHHNTNLQNQNHIRFLKSAFWLGLSAFGGPQLHLPYFKKELVDKHQFITHKELIEINAFCNALPGPSTTQTISTIGLKIGGKRLSALTLFAWALPGAIFMTILALLPSLIPSQYLRFLPAVVVAFMVYGVYTMFRWLTPNAINLGIFIIVGIAGFAIHSPWIFPLGILVSAVISAYFQPDLPSPETEQKNQLNKSSQSIIEHPSEIKTENNPKDSSQSNIPNFEDSNWIRKTKYSVQTNKIKSRFNKNTRKKIRKLSYNLIWFFFIGFTGYFLAQMPVGKINKFLIELFENTYRMSALSFGGGNILAAMMLEEFVQLTQRVNMSQFHFGMAMIQAAPGPNFNLAVYMNTTAMNNLNGAWPLQILASIIGMISVFLPGLLLVFFAYPVWSKLQYTRLIQKTTPGLFAASIGFILSATLAISQDWISHFQQFKTEQITLQILAFTASLIMQASGKVQTPLVVLFGLIVGWLIPL